MKQIRVTISELEPHLDDPYLAVLGDSDPSNDGHCGFGATPAHALQALADELFATTSDGAMTLLRTAGQQTEIPA